MYIENINGPQDVKKLTVDEMGTLADEMRHALLIRASKHGGHFGPNFGMVEAAFTMYLNHQRIRLCMTCHTRAIRTRCLLEERMHTSMRRTMMM